MSASRVQARVPSRTDVEIALVTGLVGVVYIFVRLRVGDVRLPWLASVVEVLGAILVLGRRRFPLVVFGGALALSLIFPTPAVPVGLHAVGRYVRSTPVGLTAMIIGFVASWPIWLLTSSVRVPGELATYALFATLPFFVGRAERASAELAAERAAREAERRERLAQDARLTERQVISREMHDVVAHRISLIVLHANLLAEQPAGAAVRAELDQIRSLARAALDEMRMVLGLLQRVDVGGRGVAGGHSLRDIETLAAEARAVGQPVQVDIDVAPGDVPDVTERTAYRVVREALTNAERHAPGAATEVRVGSDGPWLRVVVANAAPAARPVGLTTGGNGLRGLRERVTLVGGSITAEPAPDGGFVVDAQLPRRTP